MISAGLALALQLFWYSDASAQRTAEGSTFLGVSSTVSAYAVPSGGLDICAGRIPALVTVEGRGAGH